MIDFTISMLGGASMYWDTHMHVWELERGDYGWIKPDNETLYQNYLPDQLQPALLKHKVEGAILVQAAPTAAEVDFMLDLADRHSFIRGVVGGLDPTRADCLEEYNRLRKHSAFVGNRFNGHALHDGANRSRILAMFERFAEDGNTADFLIGIDDMQALGECLKQVPGLKAVINHLGNPPMRSGQMQPWAALIDQLAVHPNVTVKLSGMITKVSGVKPELVQPYVAHLAQAFGPDRLMFGGDWPVALLGGSYDEVIKLFEQSLPEQWSEVERDQVRYGNAKRVYAGILG